MEFEWVTFLDAVALVLIIEGILPFIKPDAFRKYLETMNKQNDSFLRVMGCISMFIGVVILYLVRLFFDL